MEGNKEGSKPESRTTIAVRNFLEKLNEKMRANPVKSGLYSVLLGLATSNVAISAVNIAMGDTSHAESAALAAAFSISVLAGAELHLRVTKRIGPRK